MSYSFSKNFKAEKIFLFFFFCGLTSTCILRAQTISMQKTIGGSSLDAMRVVRQTNDGGYILGGSSISDVSADKTENNLDTTGQVYSYDIWIVKVNSLGNIQWQNTLGGYCSDTFTDIIETLDGGYMCSGSSKSTISADKTEVNRDASLITSDNWLLKLDAAGNIQWQKTYGGNNVEYCTNICQTLDGGYVTGASTGSNISGDKTENTCNSTSSFDYWVIKMDAAGSIQWQQNIGGAANDLLARVLPTADGGYICGGQSQSDTTCDKTENPVSFFKDDYWILKLDSAGNIEWQNTIGGTDRDYLSDLKQTADGGYICVGQSLSNASGDKTENSMGSQDYWVVKLNALGNIEWQNTIGGNSGDIPYCVIQTTDGGYAIGGSSVSGVSGDKVDSCRGNNDYWFVKLSADGILQWQRTLGGTLNDEMYSLAQTFDGDFILGGESNSNISGEKAEDCKGDGDYWIIKLKNEINLVTGKVFADLNSNGNQDTGEPNLTHKTITEQSTGNIAFSEQDGSYSLAIADTGNFNLTASSLNNFAFSPLNHIAYFNSFQQIDSINDFMYQPLSMFNDLGVTLTPLCVFRNNAPADYMISYINSGTTNLNTSIVFYNNPHMVYYSSSVAPATVTSDSVVWNMGTLVPFQSGNILVTLIINTGLPWGYQLPSFVLINPIASDFNIFDNISVDTSSIIASYDPNDITVSEDTLLTTELPTAPWLYYTIRFQNTGNDTAFTVKILNPIDTNTLQLSSIEYVAGSHPLSLNWIPRDKSMLFTFNNILLPDSNINEPQSHGFVKYRIKPKTSLLGGDSITNKGYIYFDFNAPVETNTAITRIVLPTSIKELAKSSGHLAIFPNPAKDEMNIQINNSKANNLITVSIFDVLGNTVLSKQSATANCKLPTANFSKGIYFVEVKTGKEIYMAKFVKE